MVMFVDRFDLWVLMRPRKTRKEKQNLNRYSDHLDKGKGRVPA